MILGYMKEMAQQFLGKEVRNAVVTVPAYFNDAQRQATKDAGKIAGLNILRIINEPTAAALAFGMEAKSESERNILVFDLGGGTLDVSVIGIEQGIFEVKATSGNTALGGEDFDKKLLEFCITDFKKQSGGVDIKKNKKALRKLKAQCEKAKIILSRANKAPINCECLAEGEDYNTNISRAKFESLIMDLIYDCMDVVEQVLKDSGIPKSQVDEIVLVGGSTRIPKIQAELSDFFDDKQLNESVNPDEAVA